MGEAVPCTFRGPISSSSVLSAGWSTALGGSSLPNLPTGASSTPRLRQAAGSWAAEWTGCLKGCLCFSSSSNEEKLKPTTSGEVGPFLLVVIETAVTIIVVIDAVLPVGDFS